MKESETAKCKIVLVSGRVMPYRCALYRSLAGSSIIDLEILFLDDWGKEPKFDPTMSTTLAWDVPVLTGFKHEFMARSSIFDVTYTGADKLKTESKLPILGSWLYYFRTMFGMFSIEALRRVRKSDYDILILEEYCSITAFVCMLIAKLRGKRLFLRGESTLQEERPLLLRIIKWIYLRFIFQLFDNFMYSCDQNKRYYRYYLAPSESLTFVPSAVDNDYFEGERRKLKTMKCREQVRDNLYLPHDAVIYLGVGRLVNRKNWIELIRAFELISKERTSSALLLVGDGPERINLEEYISENDIKNVVFVGFRNQSCISFYYEASDVMCLTSTYDPSPKVLNEGIVFGLPLIVSDKIGTANEICVHGKNGFVYRSGDVIDLSDKMKLIYDNTGLRESYGLASKQLSDQWSIQVGVRNIEELLENDMHFFENNNERLDNPLSFSHANCRPFIPGN